MHFGKRVQIVSKTKTEQSPVNNGGEAMEGLHFTRWLQSNVNGGESQVRRRYRNLATGRLGA